MNKENEVWYNTKELIHYIHSVIEDCALIVCPNPHVEEERTCDEVASQIRKLKNKWRDSEFVLRTTSDDNLFRERNKILMKLKRTEEEELRLKTLQDKIMNLRTASNPRDAEAMELIHKAAELLRKKDGKSKK